MTRDPFLRMVAALGCVGALTAAATAPGEATRDNAVGDVFAADSPFYRQLPDDTPVADDSEELVAGLVRQGEENFGRPGAPNLTINVHFYTAPLFATGADDPVHDIRPWNCQDKPLGWDTELAQMWQGVHLPHDLRPDQASDGLVSIYDQDSDRLVELWQARVGADGVWEACWGGVIDDVSRAQGTFEVPYGASAGGLALYGYTIRHQELLDGRIEHVVGLGIPEIRSDVISAPAVRTDGRVGGPALAMGQMLRLPADLDLDALQLAPSARAVAEAAQRYGLIITDTSGALSLAGEHVHSVEDDQYDQIFRGRYSSEEMAGDPARGEDPFPLDQLVALPLDYLPPPSPPAPAEAVVTTHPPAPEPQPIPEEPDQDEADDDLPPWVLTGLAGLTLLAGLTVVLLRRRGRRQKPTGAQPAAEQRAR